MPLLPSDDHPPLSIVQARIFVRALQEQDIAGLDAILREHVRDLHSGAVVDSEVQAIKAYMQGATDDAGRTRRYRVACDAGKDGGVIGCMALSAPDQRMAVHFGADAVAAVELLNAFVASSHVRGNGVGRALFNAMCDLGASDGARHLLVNSGPRYRRSWAFYDRVCDSSHGFIDDYYGEGRHAKTWKKNLRAFA